MPRSKLLDLALAFRQSLLDNLQPILDEVNAEYPLPAQAITMPLDIDLGINTEMLDAKMADLPTMSAGVYGMDPIKEGEQEYSETVYTLAIDVYIGATTKFDLTIMGHKWILALDLWCERYASSLTGYITAPEKMDMVVTPPVKERDKTYRLLVTATGAFTGFE